MRLFSIGLLLLFCQHTALAGYKVYRHIYNKTGETWKITKTGTRYANSGNLYVHGKMLDRDDDFALIPPGTHTLDYTSTFASIAGYIKLTPVSQPPQDIQHAYYYVNARFNFYEIFDTRVVLNQPAEGDITLLPAPTQHQ